MMSFGALLADITPTSVAAYEDRRGREETFVRDDPAQEPEGTPFVSYRDLVPSSLREGQTTPAAAGHPEIPVAELAPPAPNGEDAVVRARDARVALLARRYEGVSSVEDEARIKILTLRLRRLSPRVTETDLADLDAMVGELEKVSTNLDAIRAKFGVR